MLLEVLHERGVDVADLLRPEGLGGLRPPVRGCLLESHEGQSPDHARRD
jgi:hypothetical protein